MVEIYYSDVLVLISGIWLAVRAACALKNREIDLKREAELLLVYICIVVVVRYTFFPFGKINGQIQPLLFCAKFVFPFRINLLPVVYLLDYPVFREAILNFVGNFAMFIPLGIVWPAVFKKLNNHKKVILAGVGISLCIEILQLPFFDRVSDIDDLLLNSLGYLAGYGIYLLARKIKQ